MEKGQGRRGTYHLHGENPEIPGGESHGSRHSVWEGSENMGVILGNTIFLLFLVCSTDLDKTFRRVVLLPRQSL